MIVHESYIRDILRLIIWYPLRAFIVCMPWRMGLYLMRAMGDIHYFLDARKRRRLINNLQPMGLSRQDQLKAVRVYFQNHYTDRLSILSFSDFDLDQVLKTISFQGLKYLDQTLSQGRGAILVHGHFGPAHYPLVAFARMGYPIKQIGNPSEQGLSRIGRKVAFRLRMKYENQMPAEIFKAGAYLRPVHRWLARNGVVMIAGDGTGTARTIGKQQVSQMFGYSMMFPQGPARLSLSTGAPLLPLFILPDSCGTFRVIIEPPLHTGVTCGDPVAGLTEAFVKRLVHHIASYPGYMHFLDRFHKGGPIVL